MFKFFKKKTTNIFNYYNLDKFFLSLDEKEQLYLKEEILKCFVTLNENSFVSLNNTTDLPTKTDFIIKLSKRLSNKKDFDLSTKLLEFASDKSKSFDEKHVFLNLLIEVLYKQRENESYLEKCKNRCLEDINLINKKKVEDKEPISYKRLAIILESEGKKEELINLSKNAIKLGLQDGTKTGYEGRIQKFS